MRNRKTIQKRILELMSITMILFLSTIITGCFNEVENTVTGNDPVPENVVYTMKALKNGAFRGGSIINNDSDKAGDQLVEEMEIPFRLSSIPQSARRNRSDYEPVVQYGYITIKKIIEEPADGSEKIIFDYLLYSEDGDIEIYQEDLVLVSSPGGRNALDLNHDGMDDIFFNTYNHISSRMKSGKREMLTGSSVLRFSDPRENGNSCSFRLLPENYEDDKLPSGILSVNPNGAIIATSQYAELYEGITPTATLVAFRNKGLPEISKGDFIMDTKTNRFREIISIPEKKDGYTIYESTDTTFDRSFIIFDLEYSEPYTVSLEKPPSEGERINYDYEFDEVIWEKEKVTDHGTLTQTLEATGNVDVTVNLNASVHAGIKWHWWPPHPSIELECDVGIDFDFDHHFYLEYLADGEYTRTWTKKLFEENKTIMVDVIPVDLQAKGTVGLKVWGDAQARFWTGYRLHGGMSAGAGYKLGDGFHTNFDQYLNFERYGPTMKMKGKVNAKPYFNLELGIGFAYIVWVKSETEPYALGVLDGNAGLYLDEDYDIHPEDMWIDFNLYGGLEQDLKLQLGYKWFSISKTFNLYNHKWPIWDIEFKWPEAPADFRSHSSYTTNTFEWLDRSRVESGYKLYQKVYGADDFNELVSLPANTQRYSYHGNKDAEYKVKSFYHVKHLDFNIYQIPEAETIQIIACPELMTGVPENGNPHLKWVDKSEMNTETDLFIKKEDDPEYTRIATTSGQADDYHYVMPENIDSQFKSRAVYRPDEGSPILSSFSNAYQWLAIPTGMTGFPHNDGEILLSWRNNSHKSEGYDLWSKVYLEDASITVLDDPASKSYVFKRVDGVNWDKKDAQFKIRNFVYDTTLGKNTYSGWSNTFQWLAAPTDFEVERVFDTNILTWEDNSHCEDGYEIWKAIDQDNVFKTGITGENCTKTLDKPSTYESEEFAYKTRAYKDTTSAQGYSDWSSMSIHNFRAPDSLAISQVPDFDTVELSWKNNSKFQTGFIIKRRSSGQGEFITFQEVGETVSSYQLNDDDSGYDYLVQAVYREGETEQFSNYSNIVKYSLE